MPQPLFSAPRIVKDGEEIRADITEFKGKKYLSVRVYYLDTRDGEMKPGKNGINLPLEEAGLFIDAADSLATVLFPETEESEA